MLSVAALYHFAPVNDPAALRDPLRALCDGQGVKGTVLIAPEGVNGTVAGPRGGVDAVLCHIREWPGFAQMEVKYSPADTMPFGRMKVRIKREIVTMGIDGIDPRSDTGTYVDAKDWDQIIADPNVILIDTRNDYEIAVGTFPRAINPKTETFREFPAWFDQLSESLRAKGTTPRVAMFCTGGIRCEKASAYVKAQGFDDVLHLRGGILKYLESVPADKSSWQGECFVFDDRVALGTGLKQGDALLCAICGRANSPGAPCKDCILPGRDKTK
jgi:UPF0176 protein